MAGTGSGSEVLDNLAMLLGAKGPNDQQQQQPGWGARANPAAAVSDDPSISKPISTPPPVAQPAPVAAPPVAPPVAPPPVAPVAPPTPTQFPIPTTPKFQSPNVDRVKDLQDQIAAHSQPVTHADHPGSWWQKLLSIPVAALVAGAGGDVKQGVTVGSALANRNYNHAVRDQNEQLDPLYKQLDMQEKASGLYRDANTNSQNTFEDSLKGHDAFQKQQEADETQSTRAPEVRTGPDGKTQYIYRTRGGQEFPGPEPANITNSKTREEEDKNTPAPGARAEKDPADPSGKTLRVRTKAGGYMPYSAKTIEEGALNGDPTATALFNREHREKGEPGEKKATPAQYSKVQGDRDKGWDAAHKEYAKALEAISPKDTEGRKQAQQDFYDKRQEIQDEYEDQINTLGGSASHTKLPRNLFGEEQPDAAPAASPSSGAPANAPKSVTKDVVQKYADSHKLTFAQAQKGFQGKGYQIK